jgi:hypothetical protein
MKKNKSIYVAFGIGIALLLISSVPLVSSVVQRSSSSVSTMPDTSLKIHFLGSLRHFLLPAIGYGIENIGDEIAYNVTATFTVEGGISGLIHFSDTTEHEDIYPDYTGGTTYLRAVDGIGAVTVTVSAVASNAEAVERTAQGLQIGFRTIIFG